MKICIIIPIYNQIPGSNEITSITRNISVLKDYDIYAVHPQSMSIEAYSGYGFTKFISFHDSYFVSNKSYSRLILSKDFYDFFTDYEYMLIAQTDTYILNTDYTLQQFAEMGYDYLGAPWPDGPFDRPYGIKEYFKSIFVHNPSSLHVGNGGFTLRKVKACQDIVKKYRLYIKYLWCLNEDLFFSSHLKNIAPLEIAEKFALETNMKKKIDSGFYPYGLHAYEKHLGCDISEIKKADQ